MADLLQLIKNHFPSDDPLSRAGRDIDAFASFCTNHLKCEGESRDVVMRRVEQLSGLLHPYKDWMLQYVGLDETISDHSIKRVVEEIFVKKIAPAVTVESKKDVNSETTFFIFYSKKVQCLRGSKYDMIREAMNKAVEPRDTGRYRDQKEMCDLLKKYEYVLPAVLSDILLWDFFCQAHAHNAQELSRVSGLFLSIDEIWDCLPSQMPWEESYNSSKTGNEWLVELESPLLQAWDVLRHDATGLYLRQSDLYFKQRIRKSYGNVERLNKLMGDINRMITWEALTNNELLKDILCDTKKSIGFLIRVAMLRPAYRDWHSASHITEEQWDIVSLQVNQLCVEFYPYARLLAFIIDCKHGTPSEGIDHNKVTSLCDEVKLSPIFLYLLIKKISSGRTRTQADIMLRCWGSGFFADNNFREGILALDEESPDWVKFFVMCMLDDFKYSGCSCLEETLNVAELDAVKEYLDLDAWPVLNYMNRFLWAQRKAEALTRLDQQS